MEDVVISVDSWEYPTYFMVLQPKSNLGGYPLILGRPWLATTNAYIGCRSNNMTISHRNSTKKVTLYPHVKPTTNHEMPIWMGNEDNDDESVHQILTLDQELSFKEEIEDDAINNFISNPYSSPQPTS